MLKIKDIYIKGKDLNDTWFQLLWGIDSIGRKVKIDSGSFEGIDTYRVEFDFAAGIIEYPTIRPLSPIMPSNMDPVTTDDIIGDYFVNYLMNGNLEVNEHYKYATWINGGYYNIPNIEVGELIGCQTIKVPQQLEWCINHFKNKGLYNNHCYIQVGYPESCFAYDVPYKNPEDRQTSPCLRGIDLKIVDEDGKNYLLSHVYFRSWDLYSAWPTNMGGITLLLEYIARELNVEVGFLSFSSEKLHCYSHQIKSLKKRLGKE